MKVYCISNFVDRKKVENWFRNGKMGWYQVREKSSVEMCVTGSQDFPIWKPFLLWKVKEVTLGTWYLYGV